MAVKLPQRVYRDVPTPLLNFMRWLQHRAMLESSHWTEPNLPPGSSVEALPPKNGAIPLLDRSQLLADAAAVVGTPGRISDLMALRLSSDLMAAAERSIRLRGMSVPRRRYQAAYRQMTLASTGGPVDGLLRYIKDMVRGLGESRGA